MYFIVLLVYKIWFCNWIVYTYSQYRLVQVLIYAFIFNHILHAFYILLNCTAVYFFSVKHHMLFRFMGHNNLTSKSIYFLTFVVLEAEGHDLSIFVMLQYYNSEHTIASRFDEASIRKEFRTRSRCALGSRRKCLSELVKSGLCGEWPLALCLTRVRWKLYLSFS